MLPLRNTIIEWGDVMDADPEALQHVPARLERGTKGIHVCNTRASGAFTAVLARVEKRVPLAHKHRVIYPIRLRDTRAVPEVCLRAIMCSACLRFRRQKAALATSAKENFAKLCAARERSNEAALKRPLLDGA